MFKLLRYNASDLRGMAATDTELPQDILCFSANGKGDNLILEVFAEIRKILNKSRADRIKYVTSEFILTREECKEMEALLRDQGYFVSITPAWGMDGTVVSLGWGKVDGVGGYSLNYFPAKSESKLHIVDTEAEEYIWKSQRQRAIDEAQRYRAENPGYAWMDGIDDDEEEDTRDEEDLRHKCNPIVHQILELMRGLDETEKDFVMDRLHDEIR